MQPFDHFCIRRSWQKLKCGWTFQTATLKKAKIVFWMKSAPWPTTFPLPRCPKSAAERSVYASGPLFLQYNTEIKKYWKLESLAREGGIIFFILLCNPRQGQLTSDLSFLTGKKRTAVIFVRTGRSDLYCGLSD